MLVEISFIFHSQIVEVMKDEHEKWAWLKQRLIEFISRGSVLVFVTRKVNSEEVASSLKGEGHKGKFGEVTCGWKCAY